MEIKMKEKLTAFTFMLLSANHLFAEGEESMMPPDQSLWQTFMMIAIAFLFFYVILWRPEQKRRKALEEQRGGLKKGDKVAAMGIIGTVVKVGEQTVILKMYDGAKIEFYKAAITEVLASEGESAKKEEGEEKEEVKP